MKKIAVNTFGCKLNQAESAQLIEQLSGHGFTFTSFDQPADIYIINTCTVTAKAEARCRQAIRQARRLAPAAKIIVTGCYAEVGANDLGQLDAVDIILGSDYKYQIHQFLDDFSTPTQPIIRTCGGHDHPDFHSPGTGFFLENTRAFLKIQDGCNAFCAYCIVPYARGRSRSGETSKIVAQVQELVARGFKEIVLTGVHIGLFGQDANPPESLTALVQCLVKISGDFRLRLSSLEPLEVTDALLDLISDSKKVCPHLHIPLQSGDATILKAMNRHYTPAQFEELIGKVCRKIPHPGVGTDVIVGFPGETDAQFENTYRLIERLPVTYLHVFAYSVRQGTAAAKLPDKVPKSVQAERSRRLRELGRRKQFEFSVSQLQQVHPVLFEEENSGWMSGLTDNYLRIKVRANPALINTIQAVRLDEITADGILGMLG
jgi:threonylcarbamoyladenosine tRNA methylthiotransferase MtaB